MLLLWGLLGSWTVNPTSDNLSFDCGFLKTSNHMLSLHHRQQQQQTLSVSAVSLFSMLQPRFLFTDRCKSDHVLSIPEEKLP
jgi:hypothetical protein